MSEDFLVLTGKGNLLVDTNNIPYVVKKGQQLFRYATYSACDPAAVPPCLVLRLCADKCFPKCIKSNTSGATYINGTPGAPTCETKCPSPMGGCNAKEGDCDIIGDLVFGDPCTPCIKPGDFTYLFDKDQCKCDDSSSGSGSSGGSSSGGGDELCTGEYPSDMPESVTVSLAWQTRNCSDDSINTDFGTATATLVLNGLGDRPNKYGGVMMFTNGLGTFNIEVSLEIRIVDGVCYWSIVPGPNYDGGEKGWDDGNPYGSYTDASDKSFRCGFDPVYDKFTGILVSP